MNVNAADRNNFETEMRALLRASDISATELAADLRVSVSYMSAVLGGRKTFSVQRARLLYRSILSRYRGASPEAYARRLGRALAVQLIGLSRLDGVAVPADGAGYYGFAAPETVSPRFRSRAQPVLVQWSGGEPPDGRCFAPRPGAPGTPFPDGKGSL